MRCRGSDRHDYRRRPLRSTLWPSPRATIWPTGRQNIEVLGKPYDLLVRGPNGERHVEVKGSSLRIDKILLTINEVIHARTHAATDLFVVDEIEWQLEVDGAFKTAGGRKRIWRSWSPQDERLSAVQFQYELGESES